MIGFLLFAAVYLVPKYQREGIERINAVTAQQEADREKWDAVSRKADESRREMNLLLSGDEAGAAEHFCRRYQAAAPAERAEMRSSGQSLLSALSNEKAKRRMRECLEDGR